MRTTLPLLTVLGAAAFLIASCSNPRAELASALSGVCSGRGVPEAAAYAGGGVHPVVVLASNGDSHGWSLDLPQEWDPESVEEVQLVACVEDEGEREIEECLYNGPSIHRYQYQLSARLVEARTGTVVASTELEGSLPRECRATEDYDLTRLAGSHVAFAAARDWMRGYVEAAIGSAGDAPAASNPTDHAVTISLPGDVLWLETGIEVFAGQRLVIVASGDIGTVEGAASGPDGQPTLCPVSPSDGDCPLNGAPYGILVGRIGDGPSFRIGSHLESAVLSSGQLYVAVNDNLPYYADNWGSFTVTIEVQE